MPSNNFMRRQRAQNLARHSGICHSAPEFVRRVKRDGHRLSIIMEGDSWFDYPREYIFAGKHRNMAHWMKSHVMRHNGFANILSIAHNGDSIEDVCLQPRANKLLRLINQLGSKLDYLLLSIGGNDIVGREMRRYLNDYQPDMTARDCVNAEFAAELADVESKYRPLLDTLKHRCRNIKVFTHPYCYLRPRKLGFKLVFKRIGDGYIYPYFTAKGIPEHLHLDIVKILLDGVFEMQQRLAQDYDFFHVVDTRSGILSADDKDDWADEMHPSSEGFKKLTRYFVQHINALDTRFPLL